MRTFELKVQQIKLRILRMARDENLDSDILVAALADVLGTTAAVLDMRDGLLNIDDRLDAVIERAKAEHRRILALGAQVSTLTGHQRVPGSAN